MSKEKRKVCPRWKKYIKSKKGFSLLELIVAVIILCIVISATVTGLAMSYNSILVGAEKDNMSSIAQKNCDIIMAVIDSASQSNEADVFEGMTYKLKDTVNVNQYTEVLHGTDVYAEGIEPTDDISNVADKQKGKAYYNITKTKLKENVGSEEYSLYTINTYVFYADEKYVTCTGTVTKPIPELIP